MLLLAQLLPGPPTHLPRLLLPPQASGYPIQFFARMTRGCGAENVSKHDLGQLLSGEKAGHKLSPKESRGN